MSRFSTLDHLAQIPADASVAEAARALDKDIPGWHRLVDVDKLDMSNGCRCVLGQIGSRKRWTTRLNNGYLTFHAWLVGAGKRDTIPVVFNHERRHRPAWLAAIRARLRRDS